MLHPHLSAILQAFAGWVLQHGGLFDADSPGFSQLHAQADDLLQDPRVDTNTAYWATLQRLVVLGQLEAAMRLLAHHPVLRASQEEGMGSVVRCCGICSCWTALSSCLCW